MTQSEVFEEVKKIVEGLDPKVRIEMKRDSRFHRAIAKVMFFVPYMQYSTTIGRRISLADGHGWTTLAHEGVHVVQGLRQGTLIHSLLYLFPQCLALLSLLAIWSPWFLLSLIFLLPFPAYFRMRKELEAYCVNVVLVQWVNGSLPGNGYISRIADHFVESDYYFMWPFRRYIERRLLNAEMFAATWDLDSMASNPYLNKLYQMLKRNGWLHKNAHHLRGGSSER